MKDIDGKTIEVFGLSKEQIDAMNWSMCQYGNEYVGEKCYCEKCEYDRVVKKRTADMKNETFLHYDCGIGYKHINCTLDNYEGDVSVAKSWDFKKVFTLSSNSSGNGKTHIAVALIKKYMIDNPTKKAVLINWAELVHEINSFEQFMMKTDFRRMTDACITDLICLDDIGSERLHNDKVSEELYVILNSRWYNNKPTIITTNLCADEFIARYGKRCVDRMRGTKMKIEGVSRR